MTLKKIVITAGGTGGHLYPAQGLAKELTANSPHLDILFVAGGLKTNRYFNRQDFSFKEIASYPLISRHPIKALKGFWHLLKGIRQSIKILKEYQPEQVIGFGSYYAVPTLLAAKYLKIPIILHEANSIPGRANKWLAPLATCVGVHFPSTKEIFKYKTIEVGLPLREGYHLAEVSQEQALNYYGFSSKLQTLLIFGGSQGARFINQLIEKCLPVFQQLSLQVIHLTGDIEMAGKLESLYADHSIPACVKPFENNMQMAWRVANGFIGRSGASTIAESIEFEVPGILIPYPHATDQHQEKNAHFLTGTVKSAWMLLEAGLTAQKLEETLKTFYQPAQLLSFQKFLKDYKKRSHQTTLCQLVLNLDFYTRN